MSIDVFLFGDSHMGAYKAGAEAVGVNAGGGIVLPGSHIVRGAIKAHNVKGFAFREIAAPPDGKPVSLYKNRFDKLLKQAGAEALAEIEAPMITNFGCNPTFVVRGLSLYSFDPASKKPYISRGMVTDILLDHLAEQIAVARWLQANMRKVCFAFPPIAGNVPRELWLHCERVLSDKITEFGGQIYSPAHWANTEEPIGRIRSEYMIIRNGERDPIHANAKFGERAMIDCARKLGINVAARASAT